MPLVWWCVSRQPHLAAFEKEESKCPPARVPKGRRMTSVAGKWTGSPRAERNITPGPIDTRPRPTTPVQGEEGRARARGLVVRGEPHDRVGGVLPAVGQQQRQGLPQPAAKRRVAALGSGGGRRRRRGRRRVSRVAAVRGDRRGTCRAVGEEIPWDTVSLRHPAPKSPFVRRVLGAHRGIGGGRSPQAVRE